MASALGDGSPKLRSSLEEEIERQVRMVERFRSCTLEGFLYQNKLRRFCCFFYCCCCPCCYCFFSSIFLSWLCLHVFKAVIFDKSYSSSLPVLGLASSVAEIVLQHGREERVQPRARHPRHGRADVLLALAGDEQVVQEGAEGGAEEALAQRAAAKEKYLLKYSNSYLEVVKEKEFLLRLITWYAFLAKLLTPHRLSTRHSLASSQVLLSRKMSWWSEVSLFKSSLAFPGEEKGRSNHFEGGPAPITLNLDDAASFTRYLAMSKSPIYSYTGS